MAAASRVALSRKLTRIMIVDDHPALCEGLAHRISAQEDLCFCGQAADVDEALKAIREANPDVVIVDIALKNSDGLDLVKAIHARHQHVRTLIHSMYDEQVYADRCLRAGAMGYVNKEADPDEVIKAIRQVLEGQYYLSPAMTSAILDRAARGSELQLDAVDTLTDRQLEVFRLIGEGRTCQEIADRLFISSHTVDTHRENIKRKLQIASATELTRQATLWVSRQS